MSETETIDLTGYPQDYGWVPHRENTWTYRYAKLRKPLVMSHYTQRWVGNEPQFREVPCEAGQKVKIVMVSRFGDVGITEDLSADVGYGARVALTELYDFTEK